MRPRLGDQQVGVPTQLLHLGSAKQTPCGRLRIARQNPHYVGSYFLWIGDVIAIVRSEGQADWMMTIAPHPVRQMVPDLVPERGSYSGGVGRRVDPYQRVLENLRLINIKATKPGPV